MFYLLFYWFICCLLMQVLFSDLSYIVYKFLKQKLIKYYNQAAFNSWKNLTPFQIFSLPYWIRLYKSYFTKYQRKFELRLTTSNTKNDLKRKAYLLGNIELLYNFHCYEANICTYSWHVVSSRSQVNRDDPSISRVIVRMIFRHQTNPICTKEDLPRLHKSCHPQLSNIFSDL